MNQQYTDLIENHLYSFYRKAALLGNIELRNFDHFSCVLGQPGTWPLYCFDINCNDDKISETAQYMVSEMKLHNIPPFVVVGNRLNQSVADQQFSSLGMKLSMQWSAMASSVSQLHETPKIEGLSIEIISSTEKLKTYLHLVSTQLMRSRKPNFDVFSKMLTDGEVCLYLASYNGEPIGTALLYCREQIAGIYMVSVNESFRGMGIGKALTARMMSDAFQQNCRTAILHATKDGERVYRKFGFEEYGKINIYWLVGKEFM